MKKLLMTNIQNLAEANNGNCLSKTYRGAHAKLKWQCGRGHQWEAAYTSIQQGCWCPECKNLKKKTIKDAQNLARINNGKCLSKKYINSKTKLKWQCKKGHQWMAKYNAIQGGQWCPECKNLKRKTIEDALNLAEINNGKCLSKKYVNNKTKLRWQCKNGHQWIAKYNVIQRGHWCPKCKASKKQKKLSEILSVLLEEEPITIRPQWLKNSSTNRSLEIDIYFPKHKIAIEYNGRQHYIPIDFAGKGKKWAKKQLKSIQARDKLKRKLIKQNSDKVKYFIIFTYRNKIVKENIKNILIKKKIL